MPLISLLRMDSIARYQATKIICKRRLASAGATTTTTTTKSRGISCQSSTASHISSGANTNMASSCRRPAATVIRMPVYYHTQGVVTNLLFQRKQTVKTAGVITATRSYIVLPSNLQEVLRLFTFNGLHKYVFGANTNNNISKGLKLLTVLKKSNSGGNNTRKGLKRLIFLNNSNNSGSASCKTTDTSNKLSSSSNAATVTKSMIMARRANIFLAKAKRERSAMMNDFKRSIIGAAVYRRSTMTRRRSTNTTTIMVRRANMFLTKAADAVKRLRSKALMRIKSRYTAAAGSLTTTSLYPNNKGTIGDELKNNDSSLLVHPNSKFDWNDFPLTSHVLTTDDANDKINNNAAAANTMSSRRYINPWSISACQHEPFINYLKWKWHRTFYTKDKTPKSLQDFIEKTKSYISSSNNQNIFSNEHNFGTPNCATGSSSSNKTTSSNSCSSSKDRIQCTWIGHSTCLVQMHGITILTDPVFSDSVGPAPMVASYKRYVPPSHTIEELGKEVDGGSIDIVCLSHDHYDHLDYTSIYNLVQSDSVQVKRWCVPLGMKKWLLDSFGRQQQHENIKFIDEKNVCEMEWWEDLFFDKKQQDSTATVRVKVTCAPTQHWSCRNPFDRDTRLWCSWAVETIEELQQQYPSSCASSGAKRLAFYFAGDTGIPKNGFPLHKQIGNRLGPFDLSALPIGAYLPNNFVGDSHISPMEARQLHQDLRSTYSLGIHWGTFAMGDEPFYEPPTLLRECWDDSQTTATDPFLLVRQGGFLLSDVASPVEKSEEDDKEQDAA